MSTDDFVRASELRERADPLDIIHDPREGRTSLFASESETDSQWLTIDEDWVYALEAMR